jgi:hypothetical protein
VVGGTASKGVESGGEEEVGGVFRREDDVVEEKEFVKCWESGGGIGGWRLGG